MKLKITIATELIGFYNLGNPHIGPVMVLGYFILRLESWDGFKLFYSRMYNVYLNVFFTLCKNSALI